MTLPEVLASLEAKAEPGHTALVVVDMQNDFCAEGGYVQKARGADMSGSRPLAGRIMKLVEAGRQAGVTIVWLQANYELKYLSGQALALRAGRGDAVCCEGGSWGWQLFEMRPELGDLFVEKHTYSGFHGTELDRLLRFRGIRTLVMAGVATNVCVESTLRDGYFSGYYIVVPEDCVDSYAKKLHEATLENVRLYFGEVTTAPRLEKIWARVKASHGIASQACR
jgi:nicotinamidase-related amidase